MNRRAATAPVSAKLKQTQTALQADAKLAGNRPLLSPTISLPALLTAGNKPDGAFRQLLYDVSVAAAHLESARQYLAERLGVTSPQYNIVMVIAQADSANGMSVSDVAARLNVSGAFITTEVKKLVKAQLIVKQTNPDDGRGVLLKLTDKGYERVRAIEPDLLLVNNRLFGTLSKEDFQHLSRIVGSLIGIFGQTVAVLKAMSSSAAEDEKLAPHVVEKPVATKKKR